MSPSPIVLILGAGANIGASVAKEFAANSYKVFLTSRKLPAEPNPSYSYIQGDLSYPGSVNDIFSQVRKLAGEPSVVVYNGSRLRTLI
jgi:NAD(P)-dependent dehydrogenase (short-subunit alcohol dehydrogenase family)